MTTETEIVLNGIRRSFPSGTTLLDVIHSLELEPERVAVELNRVIVHRELWPSTNLDAGAEVEIVHFVGGG